MKPRPTWVKELVRFAGNEFGIRLKLFPSDILPGCLIRTDKFVGLIIPRALRSDALRFIRYRKVNGAVRIEVSTVFDSVEELIDHLAELNDHRMIVELVNRISITEIGSA